MNRKKLLVTVGLLVILLTMTGCFRMNVTVSLEQDENWTVATEFYFDEELLEMSSEMGGEDMSQEEMDAEIEQAILEIEDEYGSEVTAEWEFLEPEGSDEIGYRMTVSGQGYDLLNEVMFEGQAVFAPQDDGTVLVEIASFSGGALGEDVMGEELDMEEALPMLAMMDIEIGFTIEGAEIVESNGEINEEGDSVSWVNDMGPFTATVRTGGAGIPNWVWWVVGIGCVLLAFVVVVVVVIIYFVRRNKKKEEDAAGAE